MSTCSICDAEFDLKGEGGTQGSFGILPVSFCPTCLSCMLDMSREMLTTDDLPSGIEPEDHFWNESCRVEEPDRIHSQGIDNFPDSANPDAPWLKEQEKRIQKGTIEVNDLNASND
tara:strand:- start:119 stop:466 length:348 start_codon:yes stop_codon:yes gene_type:complete